MAAFETHREEASQGFSFSKISRINMEDRCCLLFLDAALLR